MQEQLKRGMKSRRERNRSKRNLKRLVAFFGCLVLVLTVHQLILPALSMEQEPFCGNQNHEHTLACYSDPSMDVETPDEWMKSLPELSGNSRTDLVNVAKSQLGYRESEKNYVVGKGETKEGYTRYGARKNDPYGDWNGYFTDFVFHYASLPLKSSNPEELYNSYEGQNLMRDPSKKDAREGDLAFYEEDGVLNTGVVTKQKKNGSLVVIAGDRKGEVKKFTLGKSEVKAVANTVLGGESTDMSETSKKAGAKQRQAVAEIDYDGATLRTYQAVYGTGGLNMGPMIRTVTLEKKVNGYWKPLETNATVKDTDAIRCSISYTVPGSSFSGGSNSIIYNLPAGLKPLEEASGTVYNNDGAVVGDYRIEKNGKITITFNEEYVDKNNKNNPIQGSINFNGRIQETGGNQDGEERLQFTDDIIYNVTIEKEGVKEGNLTVSKEGGNLSSDGLIYYTIRVSSSEGTYDDIVLTDVLSGAVYEKGFRVTDGQGRTVSVTKAPKKGDDRFTVTLPQLAKGQSYTINYYGKVDASSLSGSKGNAEISNKVTATSKDSKNGTLKEEANTNKKVPLLKKTGTFDRDRNVVTWSVTINEAHMDLGGFVLKDQIKGGEAVTRATITDSKGHGKEITLPYTFPSPSTDTYKVTYETTPTMDGVGDVSVNNTASLYYKGNPITSITEGVVVGEYQPIEKKAGGDSRVENGYIITPWQVTVSGMEGVSDTIKVRDLLPEGWPNNQFFTRKQLETAKKNITDAMSAKGISVGNWKVSLFGTGGSFQSWGTISETDRFLGFEYEILTKKPKDVKVTYTYESSSDMGRGPQTLRNSVNVNGKAISEAETTYYPENISVQKWDPTLTGVEVSKHKWEELWEGQLTWNINIAVPPNQKEEDITLTEHLPEGTDPIHFSLRTPQYIDLSGYIAPAGDGTWEIPVNHGGFKPANMKLTKKGNEITLVIPWQLYKLDSGKYTFEVRVQINEDRIWHDKEHGLVHETEVKNELTVEGNAGPVTTSQTQVITKNDLIGCLSKQGNPGGNNVVNYSANFNPKGLDLNPGDDTVILTDTMGHQDNKTLGASLVPGSVKITTRDGRILSPKYTYNVKRNIPWEGKNSYILTVEVPDETPLTLSYAYRFTGYGQTTSVPLDNKIELAGVADGDVNSSRNINLVMQDSGAVANIRGIQIYKVDAQNQGVYLPGAEFALYRWDVNTGKYKQVKNKQGGTAFVTNDQGKLSLTEETMTEVSYNVAYRLVETKAPEGYFKNSTPYEFYIQHANTGDYPLLVPGSFRGEILTNGGIGYLTNEKDETDLSILKKWQDADGEYLSNPGVDSVTVKLYQKAPKSEKRLYGTYELTVAEGYKKVIQNLPVADIKPDGTKGEAYQYTVEEVSVPGYVVMVDDSEIHSGKISVINRKEAGVSLPETGGSGIVFYLSTGLLLMIASVLLLFRKKQKKA